jgi:hypothetical protein
MTEIGEMIAILNEAEDKYKNACPFCHKTPIHDFPSKKAKPITTVESIPADLKCKPLEVKGPHDYTTAAHHLISAKQCYAKLRRLVRMGSMVGYDINAPKNGISLPTVANNLTYTLNGKKPRKFGALDPDEQNAVAFAVMDKAEAQWHVGHHAVKIAVGDSEGEGDADEDDEALKGHVVSYDETVIRELLKLLDAWASSNLCEQPEDKSDKLVNDMNEISDDIRDHLNKFATPSPIDSYPYFVSRRAHEYALKKQKHKR